MEAAKDTGRGDGVKRKRASRLLLAGSSSASLLCSLVTKQLRCPKITRPRDGNRPNMCGVDPLTGFGPDSPVGADARSRFVFT